ncbi:MAG: hypothetical protein [Bacteriophage sp.]|nr:MAG: hypothetical protein [Bacteriophage sp.]
MQQLANWNMLVALNRKITELNMNWNKIDEFPNYEVSEMGQIRNSKGKILKTFTQNSGYEVVSFPKPIVKRSSYKRTVHRLVALSYLPNPDNLPQVNHKDGNKLNNQVSNLEWCSPKLNTRHSIETGLKVYNNPTQGMKLKPRGKKGGSKYFGVSKPSNRKYWLARVQSQGKVVFQKCLPTEIEAAKYYDDMVKLHGLNRPLNFPEH